MNGYSINKNEKETELEILEKVCNSVMLIMNMQFVNNNNSSQLA